MCPRLLWARLFLMTNWSAGLSVKITGLACSSLASHAQAEVSGRSPQGVALDKLCAWRRKEGGALLRAVVTCSLEGYKIPFCFLCRHCQVCGCVDVSVC